MTGLTDRVSRAPLRQLASYGLVGAVALVVASLSATSAARTLGRPFPSMVLDPFGCFSAVGLPAWQLGQTPLRFPDRISAVDRVPINPDIAIEPFPSLRVAALVAVADEAGRTHTALTFTRNGRAIGVRAAIRHVGPAELALLWGLYFSVALLTLGSGLAVRLLAGVREGARAYSFWSFGAFLFFGSFYDYHTRLALLPAFALSTPWLAAGFLWLATSFPEDTRAQTRAWRLARGTLAALFAVSGVLLAVGPYARRDLFVLRLALNQSVLLAMVALVASIVVRFRRAVGTRRSELRITLWGLAAVPLVLVVGFALTEITGASVIHIILPLITPLIPLSIGWALVRHNILGTHAVLTRQLLLFPGGCSFPWWSPSSHGLAFAVMAPRAWTTSFQRSSRVASSLRWRSPSIVSRGGCSSPPRRSFARRSSSSRRASPISIVATTSPSRSKEPSRAGSRADTFVSDPLTSWTKSATFPRTPWDDSTLANACGPKPLPGIAISSSPCAPSARSAAVLDIAPKHQGALFTEDDLALLTTVASLGAVALHNTEVIDALERTRRIEVEATRDDKRLTLGTLGAELAHEIAHPLQFFRGLLRRGASTALDADDVEIGQEEIARLERLLASLRSLEPTRARRVSISLDEPVERALVLIRETLGEKHLRPRVEIPDGCRVLADPDGLVQVFANLLRNSVQALPLRGEVGVRAHAAVDGSLLIDVWDDGPGVPEERVPTLFHRWATSRHADGGSGLGLSVAQNLVRSFEWSIEYERAEGVTRFRIRVPREGVAGDSLSREHL